MKVHAQGSFGAQLRALREVAGSTQEELRRTASVIGICQRLDALPLALELAAPWIKVLTPEHLLRRLADNALFSIDGRRDLPERQQTMNATVAWGYQLLEEDEQRAFRRFGALPGSSRTSMAYRRRGGAQLA